MLTYGALANWEREPPTRFTQLFGSTIRRIPVRQGVGTQPRSAWRIWVKVTAYVAPPFIHATLIAALSYVTFRDVLPWWLALLAACGIWAILVWFGNILLDRHLFKRLIWLRRARCRPFRTPDLAASNREVLEEHRHIIRELERTQGKVPRRRKGEPPRVAIGFIRSAPCSSPRWRTLIPIEVPLSLFAPVWAIISFPIFAGLYLLVESREFWVFPVCMLVSMVVAVAINALPLVWLEHRWKARIFGMLHGHCRQCRHDLTPLMGENHTAGPRRCPECGSHWPLVPPPTPAELREIEKQLSSLRAAKQGTTSL